MSLIQHKANGRGDDKRELPSGQWRELKTQAFPSPSGVVDESVLPLECSLDGSKLSFSETGDVEVACQNPK